MRTKRNDKKLAEGEVTGHAHVLERSDVFEDDGYRYFSCDTDTIHHEEHKPITLPRGKYASGIVSEYDHFAEEARNVKD